MPQVFEKNCKIKLIEYGDSCAMTFSMQDFLAMALEKLKKLF